MSLKDSKYCNCLYYSANALSRILKKMAEEEFKVVGLSPSYAFLLMTVNAKPGIQPSEISREMQLQPSTVTRLVEKMEQQGYLERESVGRATQVKPTQQSLDLDPKIKEAWKSLKDRYSDLLGERFSEVLTEMAYKASENLE